MADYKEKIDEWQRAARRKARELDEKYAISDLVEEGSRVAGEAAKRGAETFSNGAEKVRLEAERLTDEGEVGDTAKRLAEEALRGAEQASKVFRGVAGDAGKKAGEVIDDAKTYYDRASHIYDTGAKFTRASTRHSWPVKLATDHENPAGRDGFFSGLGVSWEPLFRLDSVLGLASPRPTFSAPRFLHTKA